MDFETARSNMIDQQIRPWNVLQMQTLNALAEIRREDFVPDQYKSLSFNDMQIPLGDGEFMLEPKIGARMIESLGIKPSHKILEIGTGTGYLTALLATMCDFVTSIEIDADLHRQAGINLAMAGIDNVELLRDDCFSFIEKNKNPEPRFDRILVTGSVPVIDHGMCNLISDSGTLSGVEGNDPAMQAVICRADGSRRTLFETSVSRLRNVDEKPQFEF